MIAHSSTLKLLPTRIDERITTLKRRIALNAKTIIPIENIFLDSQRAVPKPIAILAQNERAKRVIDECTVAIEKLSFLKIYLPSVQTDIAHYLLTNYGDFSFQEFQRRLLGMIDAEENDITMHKIPNKLRKRILHSN